MTTFLNVLMRIGTEDAPIADVINGLLSSLAEGSADITHQVITLTVPDSQRPCMREYVACIDKACISHRILCPPRTKAECSGGVLTGL